MLWGGCDQKFVRNEIPEFYLLFHLQPAFCVIFLNALIKGYVSPAILTIHHYAFAHASCERSVFENLIRIG